MQFKQYPSYKNSGVEWLGDVPEHWSVIPSKFYFIERKEKAENTDKQLTASQKHGIIFQEDFMAENGRVMVVMKNPEILKKVRPNDFVISMRSFQGGLELSYLEGSISSAYVMLKPNLNVVDIEYFKYLFKTPRYIQSLQSTSNLIRDGQALRFNNFSQVKLVLPPKADQQKIVAFLDTETTRIDNLIAKQEKLIELLEEQRKSIISHAVTKGLNPNAPMKDSGVEWLGEVPKHWEVVKSKRLFWCKGGFAFSSDDFFEEGNYPVIRISNIQDKSISTDKIVYVNSCTKKVFNQFSAYTGDLIFCMTGASLGKVGLLPKELSFALINQRVGRLDITSYAIKQFVFYLVSSHGFQTNIRMLGVGLTDNFPNISSDLIGIVDVVLPPLVEQQGIVNHLEIENSKIDTLIEKQNQLIDKLKEYRASIISHAVTGKIDVREFGA